MARRALAMNSTRPVTPSDDRYPGYIEGRATEGLCLPWPRMYADAGTAVPFKVSETKRMWDNARPGTSVYKFVFATSSTERRVPGGVDAFNRGGV